MGHFARFFASARSAECGRGHFHHHHASEGDWMGGSFGVRRPLRYLAWKLDLSEEQIGQLAKILDELKTERAQAAVDERRTTTAFADAIAGDSFGDSEAAKAGALRKESAGRVADAIMRALRSIHTMLTKEQRDRLATMIRTGQLSL